MSPIVISLLMFLLLLFSILIGFHIGVSLLSVSILGVWMIIGSFDIACKLLESEPFYATFDYTLSVIPLFILMGLLVNISGASEDLYDSVNLWVGKIHGGLGIATVIANGVFAAISGISIASAAMFSKIAYPQMQRFGYNKRFSLGTIAGSSVLGMLIPPSVLLIVYSVLSEESVGKMFIAGIIPGILLLTIYSLGIWAMSRFFPNYSGFQVIQEQSTFNGRLKSLPKNAGIFGLILLVLGGIYLGIFTPTEAGGIGTIGALALMFFRRKGTTAGLKQALGETGMMTASFFLLLIGAQMFSRMLAISGTVDALAEAVVSLPAQPVLIIVAILMVLIAMGAILDCISIMIIVLPIIIPTVKALNYDLVWFGIISVLAVETGLITPPFGMVPFTIKASLGDSAKLEDIFIGAFPFVLMMILVISLLIVFPACVTWLPNTMN